MNYYCPIYFYFNRSIFTVHYQPTGNRPPTSDTHLFPPFPFLSTLSPSTETKT